MTSTWVCLVRVKTNEGLRSHVIEKPSFVIGRTQESDLPIVDSSVSRVHLSVSVQGETVTVEDQKSANGSMLNGQPLPAGQPVVVKFGDVVQLGTSAFEFSFLAIPKPFEMMSGEAQKGVVVASMEELAKQFEARARQRFEVEVKQARLDIANELRSARIEDEKAISQLRASAETAISKARAEASQAQSDLAQAKAEAEAKTQQMRLMADKVIRQNTLEAEQVRSEAKKEIELIKTQTAIDLQNRKPLLETEMAKLRHATQLATKEERLKAQKEADLIIANAQKRIQDDLQNSSQLIEQQISSTQKESFQRLEEADSKARETLKSAREEATKIRAAAAEEARQSHAETIRKNSEMLSGMHEKLNREMAEIKAEMLERAKFEAIETRDRFLSEHSAELEALSAQVRSQTAAVERLSRDSESLEREKRKNEATLADLQGSLGAAKELLAAAHDAEQRRTAAQQQFEDFQQKHQNNVAAVERELTMAREKMDRELHELREKNLVELANRRRDQEAQLAKSKLEALESLESTIKGEEKKYEQTRRLRAVELSQALYDRLLPKLEGWLQDPGSARLSMKREIDQSTVESLVNQTSTIVANATTGVHVLPAEVQDARDRRIFKYISYVSLVLVVAIGVYGVEIYRFLRDSQRDSALKLTEQRRIQSVYNPVQTDEYRETYTDNVLFYRGYLELKTESDYYSRWTDRLNDLALLRSMSLSEEDVVTYLAKEMNLVKRLGVLRTSIDALKADEGIEKMRSVERQDTQELIAVLKGVANFKKIRALEKDFYLQFLKSHKI